MITPNIMDLVTNILGTIWQFSPLALLGYIGYQRHMNKKLLQAQDIENESNKINNDMSQLDKVERSLSVYQVLIDNLEIKLKEAHKVIEQLEIEMKSLKTEYEKLKTAYDERGDC